MYVNDPLAHRVIKNGLHLRRLASNSRRDPLNFSDAVVEHLAHFLKGASHADVHIGRGPSAPLGGTEVSGHAHYRRFAKFLHVFHLWKVPLWLRLWLRASKRQRRRPLSNCEEFKGAFGPNHRCCRTGSKASLSTQNLSLAIHSRLRVFADL